MFDKIINKINTIKEENKTLNKLLNQSSTFTNLKNLPDLSIIATKKSTNNITSICPDINKEKASIINKLIPIDETYLDVLYIKELKTNIDYWLVPTNKYIWIINEKKYGIITYQNIKVCTIIKNNLMSKIININNILIEINGNDNKINNFISILTNNEFRNNFINEKTKYLCGIIPTYQIFNNINSGISIDKDYNIVFHSSSNNYLVPLNNLINYEVLIDNNCVISKNQSRNTSINSFHSNCYTITLRITTTNNSFIIPILEQNSLGIQYSIHDNLYINSINFAKEIIDKLNEITKK